MTEAKPKRRWFRFSLRVLFVVMTVLCVWLGFTVNAARRQREAVAAISKAGGTVIYDYQFLWPDSVSRTWPDYNRNGLPPGPVWLRNLIGNDYFKTVLGVELFKVDLTASDLSFLRSVKHLKVLTLPRSKIDDVGMERIGELTTLEVLHVADNHITNAALAHVQYLTNLELLDLHNTDITDRGLSFLKGLKKMRTLWRQGTKVTFDGVRELQQSLPNCTIVAQ